MTGEHPELDELQANYKAAVEAWIAAIRKEEALVSVNHSVAEVDKWEQAHFQEDEMRSAVKDAKAKYEDALREEFFGMVRQHQTSDAQLRIGESRDSGFDASHRSGMTEDTRLPSRDANAPELCMNLSLRNRGRRKRRVHGRTRSLACKMKKAHEQVTTGSAGSPGVSCAVVLTAYSVLPGDRALLSPSPRNAKHCRELTPASGRQDHTALPSATGAVRLSAPKRPPHPAPTVRDDRDTPLFSGAGWREVLKMICPTAKVEMPAAD